MLPLFFFFDQMVVLHKLWKCVLFHLISFFFCSHHIQTWRVSLIGISQITKWYNITNFCVTSNMLHHKYNDKSFSGVSKKRVSQRNDPPPPPVAKWSPQSKMIPPSQNNLPNAKQSPNAKRSHYTVPLPCGEEPGFQTGHDSG